ncbi:MAG: hypothetical protein U0790_11955 [Isosphaeraceae bacterium]
MKNRCWLTSAAAALMVPWLLAPARGEEPAKPTEIAFDPAPAPSPALRYRLLPLSSELQPGDAAPVYLRARHEISDSWKEIGEKSSAWLEMPLDKFPADEARAFVKSWGGRIRQLEFAARRSSCDWSYTLPEQRLEAFDILLPDVQDLRTWARLLAVKARAEIVNREYDQAARTLETGIAMGRHVGNGPFLINALVGMAICGNMLDRVEELSARPHSPNLYWALAALPRPLVSIREAMETEQRVIEDMVPELALADAPSSPAGWTARLERLHARVQSLAKRIGAEGDAKLDDATRKALDAEFAAFRKTHLAPSREYLKDTRHLVPSVVDAMSDDEAIARAFSDQYRVLRDEVYKSWYLPYREARGQLAATEQKLKSTPPGPLAVFAQVQPAIAAALGAEIRTDRRVAALRAIEAIRMQAAADGKLPASLAAVTVVPVPDDPATGRPFEYHLENGTATLSAPPEGIRGPAPNYRLSIRKPAHER